LSNEKVSGLSSPVSIVVFEKSIVFMSILGGVPVFNLNMLNPNSFNLLDKNFDSFSPCGPPGVLLSPTNIAPFK